MSRSEHLLKKLLLKPTPSSFTWKELVTLMAGFGYTVISKQGSRRRFFNRKTGMVLMLHEPHPTKELKQYCVKNVVKHLKENGFIDE